MHDRTSYRNVHVQIFSSGKNIIQGRLNSIPESFAFSTISKFEVTLSVSLRAQTKRIVKDGGQLRNVL